MASGAQPVREPNADARARRNARAVVQEQTKQIAAEATALQIASLFNGGSKIASTLTAANAAQTAANTAQATANAAQTTANVAVASAEEAIIRSTIGL